jgi:lipoprotein-anchoring transpeptidase ErfK/SrfK
MSRARRGVLGLLVLGVLGGVFSGAAAQGTPLVTPQAVPQEQVTPRVIFRVEPVTAATIRKQYSPAQLGILEKLNRRDLEHLARLKEMIVPEVWPNVEPAESDELAFGVMPLTWEWATDRNKAIVVLQPEQLFGAYEFGKLVRWGPISSGRKETATPAGTFNLTWKTKSRVSTDNDQWLLKWYFNFINSRGVSFHQFELPGYAASHACVRLLERDAMWLYGWGEQWKLAPGGRDVLQHGTVVVVSGQYGHDKPAPWTSLDWWTELPVKIK